MKGPIEDTQWPSRLAARTANAESLRGYDIDTDLALLYSPSEVFFLASTGKLPAPEDLHRLNEALVLIGHTWIAEAPVHAAVVARLCGAPTSGILATGVLGLAEQAAQLVTRWRNGSLEDSRVARGLEALAELGLSRNAQLETALVWSRLGPLMGEALRHKPGAFRRYPIRLPDYVYVSDEIDE